MGGKKVLASMRYLLNSGFVFMGIVTVSSTYQIVIPKGVREKMDLNPGQKVIFVQKDGVVRLIPEKLIKKMRGFAKGVTSEDLRHEGDHF